MMQGNTTEKCEECGSYLEAEFVDIGIGFEQVTKGTCPNNCGYIDWLYEEYKKGTTNPLSMDEWLKAHEEEIK